MQQNRISVDGFNVESIEKLMPHLLKTIISENSNAFCCPIQIYQSLIQLYEITTGKTHYEIGKLLGESEDKFIENYKRLSKSLNYNKGQDNYCRLSSLWLNSITVKELFLNIIKDNLDMCIETGIFGSNELAEKYASWLSKASEGKFSDTLPENSDIVLQSVLDYCCSWVSELSSRSSMNISFHTAEGDIICDMIGRDDLEVKTFMGRNFSGIVLRLKNGGTFIVIMPNEEWSVNELATDETVIDIICGKLEKNRCKNTL